MRSKWFRRPWGSFFGAVLLPRLKRFPAENPRHLIKVYAPCQCGFPMNTESLFDSLRTIDDVPGGLSAFPLMAYGFPGLRGQLVRLFPPIGW